MTSMTFDLNRPTPGTYRARLAKGAVYVPVLIYRPCRCTVGDPEEHYWSETCDRYPRLSALVDGWEERDPAEVWTWCWPIDQAEYDYLVQEHAWAREHDPLGSTANPKRAIDLRREEPLF